MLSLLRLHTMYLLLALAAPAATITIPAISRGYINSRGVSSFGGTEQYLVAATLDAQGPVEYRNEFLFLLPALSGPIQSAVLQLDTAAIQVPDQTGKTYLLTSSPLLFALFSDLGAGTEYGSYTYQNTDAFHQVEISLNAKALAGLHSHTPIALSGRFGGLQAADYGKSGQIPPGTIAFLGSANRTVALVLTVSDGTQAAPEPSAAGLIELGLLAAAGRYIARRIRPAKRNATPPLSSTAWQSDQAPRSDPG